MADDKNGRENQADRADKRQRERAVTEELERGDEPEPPADRIDIDEFDTAVEPLAFPVSGSDLIAAVGDLEIETGDRTLTVGQLIPDTDAETLTSPASVRNRIRHPTVAIAMKRVMEASQSLSGATLKGSQRDGYEKTFRALSNLDADDDDQGVQAIADWIIERIHTKQKLPGSRDVRREAAKFCRANGFQVRNDEWLGI